MAITTKDHVRAAYRGTIDSEQDGWLEGRIDAAEALLAARRGSLSSWAGTDEARLHLIREVVAAAVLRLVRADDDGSVQTSETIGPTSYGTKTDPRAASSTLWFTTEEWALVGIRRNRAGTVRSRIGW